MDFDFPLIPLLPLPITLVPAATFLALENTQSQVPQVFASSVSIGVSKSSANGSNPTSPFYASSSSSTSSLLTEQERLGAIVDALGQASAKAQELPSSITQTQRLAQNPTQRVYILRTGLDNGEDQWQDRLDIGSPLMQESIRKNRLHQSGTTTRTTTMAVTELMDGIMSVQEQESKKSTRTRDEEKGVRVAGMLKMGEKKLFIVDKSGRMHEQHVCCVLDFYVDESSQRRGFGKLLFDYMIKVEGIDPTQIAYDRPSPKLFRFLNKYFGLKRHLPQPNMYAIFEGFKLDCGETIQVDDSILPAGRGSPTFETSSLFPADGNANGFNQGGTKPTAVNRALQSSLVFSSEVSVNSSGDATGTKPIVVNRGLQSSSVFNSEPKLDSSSPSSGRTTGTRPVVINRALQSSLVFGSGVPFESSENSGRQQHHKRVSSAFSSSFSLSGSGPPAGTPRTGTAASDRITPFLTSSIVFADPVTD